MADFQAELEKIIAEEKLTFKYAISVLKRELPQFKKIHENLDKVRQTIKSGANTLRPSIEHWCEKTVVEAFRFLFRLQDKIAMVEGHIGTEYERILRREDSIPSHIAELLGIVIHDLRSFERYLKWLHTTSDWIGGWARAKQLVDPTINISTFVHKSEMYWESIYSHLHVEALDWLLEKQQLGNNYLRKNKEYIQRTIERQLQVLLPGKVIAVKAIPERKEEESVSFARASSLHLALYQGEWHREEYEPKKLIKKIPILKFPFLIRAVIDGEKREKEIIIYFYNTKIFVQTHGEFYSEKRPELAIRKALEHLITYFFR
ncbi:hypothetical protein J4210_05660 [Candidatus Woesearchaeota archaeon]|nr:hypothetical protein [Candidatus Woesearchaeota archaeon]